MKYNSKISKQILLYKNIRHVRSRYKLKKINIIEYEDTYRRYCVYIRKTTLKYCTRVYRRTQFIVALDLTIEQIT